MDFFACGKIYLSIVQLFCTFQKQNKKKSKKIKLLHRHSPGLSLWTGLNTSAHKQIYLHDECKQRYSLFRYLPWHTEKIWFFGFDKHKVSPASKEVVELLIMWQCVWAVCRIQPKPGPCECAREWNINRSVVAERLNRYMQKQSSSVSQRKITTTAANMESERKTELIHRCIHNICRAWTPHQKNCFFIPHYLFKHRYGFAVFDLYL